MDTQYIEYVTSAQERLDTIAYACYGDPDNWKPIIDANPSLPILSNYEAGLRLRVPVLSTSEENVNTENLPPWKQ